MRLLCNPDTKEYTLCTTKAAVSDMELTNHFSKLFDSNNWDETTGIQLIGECINTIGALNDPPNIEEVGLAISQSNNDTAAGTDGIIPEFFK